MTYDPHHTNILPEIGSPFPITEEIPAVVRGRGPGGPSSRFLLKLLAFVLIAAIAAVVAILVVDNQRSNQVATNDAEPTATAVPEASGDNDNPAPTATELEDSEPGFWQVVGVADGLNVRSGAGTDSDIIGALRLGDRHVFSTGVRSTVNGAEWKQITFGDNDTVGWVSARFLAVDVAPSEAAPTPTAAPVTSTSVVCFQGSTNKQTQVARVQFTNGTTIGGLLRTFKGDKITDQSLSGTLDRGQATVTLTDVESDKTKRQDWTFNPTSIDLGDGDLLSVVDCSTIADQLS